MHPFAQAAGDGLHVAVAAAADRPPLRRVEGEPAVVPQEREDRRAPRSRHVPGRRGPHRAHEGQEEVAREGRGEAALAQERAEGRAAAPVASSRASARAVEARDLGEHAQVARVERPAALGEEAVQPPARVLEAAGAAAHGEAHVRGLPLDPQLRQEAARSGGRCGGCRRESRCPSSTPARRGTGRGCGRGRPAARPSRRARPRGAGKEVSGREAGDPRPDHGDPGAAGRLSHGATTGSRRVFLTKSQLNLFNRPLIRVAVAGGSLEGGWRARRGRRAAADCAYL